MKKATKEEVEKWREEDFWNKMDFNPAWIFILPALLVVLALGAAYFFVQFIIPSAL